MIFAVFLALIAYIIYSQVIKPWLVVQKYGKFKGIYKYYFPLAGFLVFHYNDLKKNDDFYYTVRQWMIDEKKRPRAIATNFKNEPMLILYDYELTRQFYNNPENYSKKMELQGVFLELVGNSIVSQEGNIHKKRRATISKIFNYEFLKQIIPDIVYLTKKTFDDMEKENPNLKSVNVLPTLSRVSGDVVARLFFNENLDTLKIDGLPMSIAFAQLAQKIGKTFHDPKFLLLGYHTCKRLGIFKSLIDDIQAFKGKAKELIKNKEKDYIARGRIPANDIIENIFHLRDNNPELSLTDDDIVDDYMTFYLAGIDTTSKLSQMFLYQMTQYPEIREKLVKENINEFYADGSNMTIDRLQKMDYLQAVTKETQRFYNCLSVLLHRTAIKDHYLGDIKVEKGTIIWIDLMARNFDSRSYSDPMTFNPDRWLDSTKTEPKDPFSFIPFSAGQHNCIGQHLAMLECKIFMSEFLKRYNFKPSDGYKLRMAIVFIYEPVVPITLDISKREEEQ